MAHNLTTEFTWQSAEYVKNARGVDWYWAVALLGVAGVTACVVLDNYLFAVIVFIAIVFIFVYASRDPVLHTVSVSQVGVEIAERMFTYEHLTHFWIENHPREGYKLLLHSDIKMMPISVLPIDDTVDVVTLRNFLISKIPEREIREPVLLQLFEALF